MKGCAGAAWSTAAGRGVVRAADSRLAVCFDNRRWRRAVPDAPAASRAAQAAGRRAGYAAGGAAVKRRDLGKRSENFRRYVQDSAADNPGADSGAVEWALRRGAGTACGGAGAEAGVRRDGPARDVCTGETAE